jgi:hypothetical protein
MRPTDSASPESPQERPFPATNSQSASDQSRTRFNQFRETTLPQRRDGISHAAPNPALIAGPLDRPQPGENASRQHSKTIMMSQEASSDAIHCTDSNGKATTEDGQCETHYGDENDTLSLDEQNINSSQISPRSIEAFTSNTKVTKPNESEAPQDQPQVQSQADVESPETLRSLSVELSTTPSIPDRLIDCELQLFTNSIPAEPCQPKQPAGKN